MLRKAVFHFLTLLPLEKHLLVRRPLLNLKEATDFLRNKDGEIKGRKEKGRKGGKGRIFLN